MQNEYDEFYEYDEQYDEEVLAILAEYRKQQLIKSSIGPTVSFIAHIVLLLLLSIFVVAKPMEYREEYVIETRELPVIEVNEKIEIEIKETQLEQAETNAPEVATPTIEAAETLSEAVEDPTDEMLESDDMMETEEFLDVVNNPTPLKLSSLYGGRTKAGRESAAKRYGGTKAGNDAVDKSLRWLAKVQEENGSWSSEPAPTGLALLCFLAHGETPLSEQYGITVQKAIQWLATNMPEDKAWGKGDGHVSYAHGIATYALAEAYAMTQIPFLLSPMENGIDIIVKGQQPEGGWDYNYKKGARWDVSVTGWQMQALKAAHIAGSSNPNLEKAIEKSLSFCKNIAYQSNSDYLGTFGYTSMGRDSGSKSMTPIGAVGLQLLGEFDSEEAQSASRATLARLMVPYQEATTNWNDKASTHLYGWYYATQAIFQYTHGQGPEWDQWNRTFQTALLRNQHPEGYWTHKERHHMGGEALKGKVLSTTFCSLQLQVYYRYLGSFKISKDKIIQTKLLDENNVLEIR